MSSFKYYSKGKFIEDVVVLDNNDEELLHRIALRLNSLWELGLNDE